MTRLYGRWAETQIGDVVVESDGGPTSLRFTFNVKKTDSARDPNTCEVKLYNLAESTRARIAEAVDRRPKQAHALSAGYEDESGRLFFGEIIGAESQREATEWVTIVRSAAGRRMNQAIANTTLAAGVTRAQQIDALLVEIERQDPLVSVAAARARVARKDFAGALDQLTHAATTTGPAMDRLASLAAASGLEVFVDDGELVVLSSSEALAGRAVVLSPATGLVGVPEIVRDDKTKHVRCRGRSLLNVKLTIGRQVWIETQSVSGAYKIRELQQSGDTHGGDWYASFEAAALTGAA